MIRCRKLTNYLITTAASKRCCFKHRARPDSGKLSVGALDALFDGLISLSTDPRYKEEIERIKEVTNTKIKQQIIQQENLDLFHTIETLGPVQLRINNTPMRVVVIENTAYEVTEFKPEKTTLRPLPVGAVECLRIRKVHCVVRWPVEILGIGANRWA